MAHEIQLAAVHTLLSVPSMPTRLQSGIERSPSDEVQYATEKRMHVHVEHLREVEDYTTGELDKNSSGEYGLGIFFSLRMGTFKEEIECTFVVEGSSSDLCGMIRLGDVLTNINNISIEDYALNNIRECLYGPAGSYVVLDLLRKEHFRDLDHLWDLHLHKRQTLEEREGRKVRNREDVVGLHPYRVVLMRGSAKQVEQLQESGEGKDADRVQEDGETSEVQELLRQEGHIMDTVYRRLAVQEAAAEKQKRRLLDATDLNIQLEAEIQDLETKLQVALGRQEMIDQEAAAISQQVQPDMFIVT